MASPENKTPFIAIKGEFEGEGLSREQVAAELNYSGRQGLPYHIKIGGCEDLSSIKYASAIGIDQITAPMVETPFAMKKYAKAVSQYEFRHVGVTIETKDAVENIAAILEAGKNVLHGVTIGRSDLTSSFDGKGVDDDKTMDMVRIVAMAARKHGLKVTMGGGISTKTRQMLLEDKALEVLIDCVETRKAVIPMRSFLDSKAFEEAVKLEVRLLELHLRKHNSFINAAEERRLNILKRVDEGFAC